MATTNALRLVGKSLVPNDVSGIEPDELEEWFESLDDILVRYGPQRLQELLVNLQERAYLRGVTLPFTANTPYVNTIPADEQPRYPGNIEIERRIKSIIRWNAMAMVSRANTKYSGVGGHISTFASSATLYEVGLNHFFHARNESHTGDFIYFQGHASPGMYARAFVEGRLTEEDLEHFRRESRRPQQGLSSYPHPWLMPNFWQFPTVSMGLGPITAIYQARFLRYLRDRGILDTSASRVWCFVGDGETDEPESLGALTLASREGLDNLTFVINCNLQRLDGPVRGNGKIIQELEAAFRGAGWNCIKVIWGTDWDPNCSRPTSTAGSSNAWAKSSTASIRNTALRRALTFANISSAFRPNCSRWRSTFRTSSSRRCAAADTIRERCSRRTMRQSTTRVRRP